MNPREGWEWFKVPTALLEDLCRVRGAALPVFLVVLEMTKYGAVKCSFRSVTEMALKSGVSERRARDAVKRLTDAGYIRCEVKPGPGPIVVYRLRWLPKGTPVPVETSVSMAGDERFVAKRSRGHSVRNTRTKRPEPADETSGIPRATGSGRSLLALSEIPEDLRETREGEHLAVAENPGLATPDPGKDAGTDPIEGSGKGEANPDGGGLSPELVAKFAAIRARTAGWLGAR